MRISYAAIKKSFRSFGKSMIIAIDLISSVVCIETFCPGSIAHQESIISQHRLVCTLFRWKCCW